MHTQCSRHYLWENVKPVVYTRACEEENKLWTGNSTGPEDLLNSRSAVPFFSRYQRLGDIHRYIAGLASSNPELAGIQNIGTSTEGNVLQVIKIGSPRSNKSAIWLDGGMHAREWISPATVTYIATQLIHNYNSEPRVRKLVDMFDWYILSVANPDGYEYSHTEDRMWRKTRSRSSPLWFCRGADPNRNFGFQWNTVGASIRPCAETYAGTRAFSEPETKAIADFILRNKHRLKAFLTFHSYSQLWMTPWGYTALRPAQYKDMEAVALKATSALKKVHGTEYKVGTSTSILCKYSLFT
ncbi:SLC6A2 [Cordylochernes scorpioides]|uniref:SLC6A2 n=1 Tax=Cordylochernes scorpioides TaxID=51811 RepID=A0ABY6JWJ2_9ARAC|nr:SLC6A2 [Cordylochernes scorpioides]